MRHPSIADTKIRKSPHARKLFGSFLFLLPSDYAIGDEQDVFSIQYSINMRCPDGG